MSHLKILLSRLVDRYGDPIWLERQDACRWELPCNNGVPAAHICFTMEPSTGKGSIWVFASESPQKSGEYIHVFDESDLGPALDALNRQLPALVH